MSDGSRSVTITGDDNTVDQSTSSEVTETTRTQNVSVRGAVAVVVAGAVAVAYVLGSDTVIDAIGRLLR